MPAQEVRLGLLWHDAAPVWGNARVEQGVDLNAEILFGKSALRPCVGVSLNTQGETSFGYCAAVLRAAGLGLVFSVGVGAALQVNAVRQLGSTALFYLAGEVGLALGKRHSISLHLAHISNAGLAPVNAGLDTLGLRWGYKWR